MANLVVAGACNLKCAYCFAGDHMRALKDSAAAAFIALEAFEARLDFLDRSGIDEIRLIGGEPTLHPHFPELIRRARRRGKHIVVFSHGLLSARALACLEALSPDECTVLVNTNATRFPDGPKEEEQIRRRATLRRLGPRALLGFTIYRTDFRLDFLLPLVIETGCRKSIRLGLAQPSLSGSNVHLHPKQYPVVGRKIAAFARKAAGAGVKLEFDCGFVRCMFSSADLAALREAGADLGWRCNPILDVDLSGQVLHCFPLADKLQAPLTGSVDAASLRTALIAQAQPYRLAGIYKECSTCPFKASGECMGGCLAGTLRRFRHATIRVVVSADTLVTAGHASSVALVG